MLVAIFWYTSALSAKPRGGKMLAYLATVAVNGPKTPLTTTLVPERVDPKPPAAITGKTGWKYVYA